ncbi:MAG: hypothetical protein ACXVEF_19570 [Polyangiales bacterium]
MSGTSPFGVELAGAIAFDDKTVPPTSAGAMLFFPKGRVAGQPVILARARTLMPGWDLSKATLAADLSAVIPKVTDKNCWDAIEGTLSGDTFDAKVTVNVSVPSDAVSTKSGTAKMCATGPVATPKLTTDSTIGMRDPVDLKINLPIDASTLSGVKLESVPITVAEVGDLVRITPTNAYLPSATMSVTLGGMSDLLGRAFTAPSAKVFVWTPTGALPAGSIGFTLDMIAGFGATFSVIDSELHLVSPSLTRYGIAIGLESKSGTTKIRIKHRFACTTFAGTIHAALIGSAGEVTPFAVSCGSTSLEEVKTLPGSGKHYLWVDATAPEKRPCWTPSPSSLPDYVLTSYALE